MAIFFCIHLGIPLLYILYTILETDRGLSHMSIVQMMIFFKPTDHPRPEAPVQRLDSPVEAGEVLSRHHRDERGEEEEQRAAQRGREEGARGGDQGRGVGHQAGGRGRARGHAEAGSEDEAGVTIMQSYVHYVHTVLRGVG